MGFDCVTSLGLVGQSLYVRVTHRTFPIAASQHRLISSPRRVYIQHDVIYFVYNLRRKPLSYYIIDSVEFIGNVIQQIRFMVFMIISCAFDKKEGRRKKNQTFYFYILKNYYTKLAKQSYTHSLPKLSMSFIYF